MPSRVAERAREWHDVDFVTTEDGARRPVYLVVALITMWLVGLRAVGEGLSVIQTVRDPFQATNALGHGNLHEVIQAAVVTATAANGKAMLPIGIAELLLGGALVVVAVRGLFRRKMSISIALQVLLANFVLTVLAYVIREPLRAAVVEAVVQSGLEPQLAGTRQDESQQIVRTKWWWSFRVALGLQLTALVLSAVALSSRASRALARAPEPSTD
jgi:hypothetical protein